VGVRFPTTVVVRDACGPVGVRFPTTVVLRRFLRPPARPGEWHRALAGVIATALGYGAPYWIGCAGLLIAAGILFVGRAHLVRIDSHRSEDALDGAVALTAAEA
jgi:hypothetical protein